VKVVEVEKGKVVTSFGIEVVQPKEGKVLEPWEVKVVEDWE
jgi:hypothetical protein